MSEFSAYILKITNISPLLVGSTGMTHNLYETLKHIPSTTIRGAIGAKVLERYCTQDAQKYGKCEPCDKKDNCEFYRFFYCNPLSITNGIYKKKLSDGDKTFCEQSDFVPAHPLIHHCKVCRADKKNHLKEWIDRNYIISTCAKCKNKTTMKPIEKYICRNCGKITENPDISFTTSTSVNRNTRSSLKQHLFRYSYIEADSVFESMLFFEQNKEIEGFLKEIEFLRLGRAKSRGFGKVVLELNPLDLGKKIEQNKTVLKSTLEKKGILLISAKTNVFNLKVDPTSPYGFISIPEFDLQKGVERSLVVLGTQKDTREFIPVLDNTLGTSSFISGWSYKTQQPKPHIATASPGALYKFSINKTNVDEDILTGLSYLEFLGLDNYARLGYNLIYFPDLNQQVEDREANE